MYLAANPSHLEAVNPVLEGIARAKQDRIDKGGSRASPVLPVLLHGDAAFAGQGVVAETLNLSQLRGYRTGGTVHVVVNNQVGFTTSPAASRSSFYCTDVARMIQAPIFHVNGDDPEACVRVARLAFEYRQEFKKDVVIDLVCYRRRGHNEGDDPSMTQPLMYDAHREQAPVRKLYTEALIGRGDISVEEAEQALRDYQGRLERCSPRPARRRSGRDRRGTGERSSGAEPASPALDIPRPSRRDWLKRIADATSRSRPASPCTPSSCRCCRSAARDGLRGRHRLGDGRAVRVRLAAARGRADPARRSGLAARHVRASGTRCSSTDKTGDEWMPLAHPRPRPGAVLVYDSLLSEFAAMGFEYGYSVARPDALVLWEAQFGDFVNGAQTIIDEFISSGEQKVGQQLVRVVLLLPHGFEGQGPDHSSGRIERFLQLCAEDNMTVAQPSTPATYFHLLRWHAYHDGRAARSSCSRRSRCCGSRRRRRR